MQQLKVSNNRRFLIQADGQPFFYLADTAWELFHRLDRVAVLQYLKDRAAKRFTVIQIVALAEFDGLHTPNANGDKPLEDDDPTRPVPAYWNFVDWVIENANALGLRVGLLPSWGDKWQKNWGIGPEIFNPDNALSYGQWIGRRYRDAGIIWIVGGDRPIQTPLERQIITAMATGIRQGDDARNLMTFHPTGARGSSENFHSEPWLDFNMWQSGHTRNSDNYHKIAQDYQRTDPIKPVLDGEPGYEDHPSGFNLDNGYLDDFDCRKAFYWATLAGACGHTYGCHPVWQFWPMAREPMTFCRRDWLEALQLPGAGDMQHGRALLESRPYLTRVPDQSLIVSENKPGSYHVQAARASDGSYALVYCPYYHPVSVDLTKLSGSKLAAWWYNPRDGQAQRLADVTAVGGQATFQPPKGIGPDWVLVLDDAGKGFPPPGQLSCSWHHL